MVRVSSQHLELPGCLVFIIQTVRVEVELPRRRRLLLVVQAVRRAAEAQPRRAVRRRGERRRRAQVARDHPPAAAAAAHGAHGGAGELVVHRRDVGAAVQTGEVGGGGRVALVVGHGVGALHAGGRGQGVGEGGDGGRAPDGGGRHRRCRRAAARGGESGAGGRRELTAGAALGAGLPERRGFLLCRSAGGLVLDPRLGLLGLLAMLGPPVFEPNLRGKQAHEERFGLLK